MAYLFLKAIKSSEEYKLAFSLMERYYFNLWENLISNRYKFSQYNNLMWFSVRILILFSIEKKFPKLYMEE